VHGSVDVGAGVDTKRQFRHVGAIAVRAPRRGILQHSGRERLTRPDSADEVWVPGCGLAFKPDLDGDAARRGLHVGERFHAQVLEP